MRKLLEEKESFISEKKMQVRREMVIDRRLVVQRSKKNAGAQGNNFYVKLQSFEKDEPTMHQWIMWSW